MSCNAILTIQWNGDKFAFSKMDLALCDVSCTCQSLVTYDLPLVFFKFVGTIEILLFWKC